MVGHMHVYFLSPATKSDVFVHVSACGFVCLKSVSKMFNEPVNWFWLTYLDSNLWKYSSTFGVRPIQDGCDSQVTLANTMMAKSQLILQIYLKAIFYVFVNISSPFLCWQASIPISDKHPALLLSRAPTPAGLFSSDVTRCLLGDSCATLLTPELCMLEKCCRRAAIGSEGTLPLRSGHPSKQSAQTPEHGLHGNYHFRWAAWCKYTLSPL